MTNEFKRKSEKTEDRYSCIILALKDKETPVLAKVLAGITVAYALSPIDLIPDFIPVLGYIDDIILLPMLIVATIKFIPKNVLDRCRKQSEGMWKEGKPKKWYYAMPIVLIWLVIIVLLLKLIFFR